MSQQGGGDFLGAQLLEVNGQRMLTLENVTLSSYGDSIAMTIVVERGARVPSTGLPAASPAASPAAFPIAHPVAHPSPSQTDGNLESSAAAAFEQQRAWVSASQAKNSRSQELRKKVESMHDELAEKLHRTYPLSMSKGYVPIQVYRQMAIRADGDEDKCVRLLHRWMDVQEKEVAWGQEEKKENEEEVASGQEEQEAALEKNSQEKQKDVFEILD